MKEGQQQKQQQKEVQPDQQRWKPKILVKEDTIVLEAPPEFEAIAGMGDKSNFTSHRTAANLTWQ